MAITGTGTYDNPYLIHNYDELCRLYEGTNPSGTATGWRSKYGYWNNGSVVYAKLTSNINGAGKHWNVSVYRDRYDNSMDAFRLYLDMNNKVISNVTIMRNGTTRVIYENTTSPLLTAEKISNGWFKNITAYLHSDGLFQFTRIGTSLAVNMESVVFDNCNVTLVEKGYPNSDPFAPTPFIPPARNAGVFIYGYLQYVVYHGTLTYADVDPDVLPGDIYKQAFAKSCTTYYCDFDVDTNNRHQTDLQYLFTNREYPATDSTSVTRCRITGSLTDSDVTLDGFIASSDVQEFVNNVVDYDVSACTMSVDDPACDIISAATSGTAAIINTDSFSAAGLNGKVSSGTGCVDLTTAGINSRTAVNATGWMPNYIWQPGSHGGTVVRTNVLEATADYKTIAQIEAEGNRYPELQYSAWRQYDSGLPFMYPFNLPEPPPPFPHLYIGDDPVDKVYRGDTQITDIYVGNTKL